MKTLSADTSIEAERVQFQIWREMPPWRKMELVCEMYATVKHLSRLGLAQRFPDATTEELDRRLKDFMLGPELAARVYGPAPHEKELPMNDQPLEITLRVTGVLEELGILYLIGGSVASGLYGEPRATMDADIIADFKIRHIEPFVGALAPEFYVDAESIREAIQAQRSFNLIHYATGFKVDVFVRKSRAFDDAQFSRRIRQVLLTSPERAAQVASPEDSILAKLEWYRAGGEISDRQWRDVLAMLKAQGERLDRPYMERNAVQLGVTDLLVRARQEAE